MVNPLWTFDRKRITDHPGIIGVDEAGRGCLAGPVIAGAVLLPRPFFQKPGNRKACAEINDSKQIKESQREELFEKIAGLEKKGNCSGRWEKHPLRKLNRKILSGPLVWQ
jgi:ribonuclease HII